MTTTQGELIQTTVNQALHDGVTLLKGDMQSTGVLLPALAFRTGLATAPCTLPRQALGLAAHLVVPPGSWAVVHGSGGERKLYDAGSYWLWGAPGTILVQWVDARRQQLPVGPIEGWSADKWRVRFWLVLELEVRDPVLVAAYREPMTMLAAAARTAAMRYMEQHSHAALTGCTETGGGLDAPAELIAARLRDDPALAGITIVQVRLLERQGDERQIEAASAATVEAARIDEALRVDDARHRARLHSLETEATEAERSHALRMAETAASARERLLQQQAEVQQAALAARLEIVMAQIRAQTAEISRDEQLWQAEQTRLHGEWERAQRQLLDSHQTDQQVRLLEAHQGLARSESEVALAAAERRASHELALAEVQQRLAEQRALQAQAIAERRASHERTLLELHLRHEALVAEQMQKLEQWRAQQVQVSVQHQRQHDRQLAGIAGAAQIAAAAATQAQPETDPQALADAGLKMLQTLAE
jgi:hypothetical protein